MTSPMCVRRAVVAAVAVVSAALVSAPAHGALVEPAAEPAAVAAAGEFTPVVIEPANTRLAKELAETTAEGTVVTPVIEASITPELSRKVKVTWLGVDVKWNKKETGRLAGYAAACATAVAGLPVPSPAKGVIAGYCGAIAAMASAAKANGDCVGFKAFYAGPKFPYIWGC